MAVAPRPPNLIRRVLDPAGSLGGEPLGWIASLVVACAIASGILMGSSKYGVVTLAPMLVGMIVTVLWKDNLGRKMSIEIDEAKPRWFGWSLGAIALVFLAILLFFGSEAAKPIACTLFGTLLPFTFVVSTRQISQQAARRPT